MTQPDPSIAPLVDPEKPSGGPPADRWVRYGGVGPVTVVDLGEWAPGEVRWVPGWLAERLLISPTFTPAEAPQAPVADAPAEAVPEPAPPAEVEPAATRSRAAK